MTRRKKRRASRSETVDPPWIAEVRKRILRWGRRNFASYPWRQDRDPWFTLIAELLLQRTRAAQAVVAYELFRSRFPTPRRLLRIGRRGVRQVTRKIGLHARGETLLAVAKLFDREGVPESAEQLRAITGIGAYTASAWLSLHRGRRATIVDSNVFRWLGRMIGRSYQRDPRGTPWVNDLADRLTPRRTFRDYNYAVLDFTMAICTPRNPKCYQCPVLSLCVYGTDRVDAAMASYNRSPVLLCYHYEL